MNKFLTVCFTLLIISCSREPLEGTVYVIKGDGTTVRAAAKTVYVLPYANFEELNDAMVLHAAKQDRLNLDSYLYKICENFEIEKINQKQFLNKFSPSCSSERLISEKLPKMVFLAEKDALDEQTAIEATELKKLTESQIMMTTDCSGSVKNYGIVTIKNNTPFTVKSGPLEAFVDDYVVHDCRDHRANLKPGADMSVSMGDCFWGTAEQENMKLVLQDNLAKVCLTHKFSDDSPVVEYMLPKEKSWDFRYLDNDEKVNFKELAKQKIGIEKYEIVETKIKDAQLSFEVLSSCREAVSKTLKMDALSCPTTGSDRTTASSFHESVSALGVAVEPLPIEYVESFSRFSERTGITKTLTDVDGRFLLEGLPNEPFFIYVNYSDNFNDVEWLTLISKDTWSIELNNSNSL